MNKIFLLQSYLGEKIQFTSIWVSEAGGKKMGKEVRKNFLKIAPENSKKMPRRRARPELKKQKNKNK